MDWHFNSWHGHIYPLGMLFLALPVIAVALAWVVLRMRAAKIRHGA
jgi:hypothetical protein